MMFITVSVTDTDHSTAQIEQIGVQNVCDDPKGHVPRSFDRADHECIYNVYYNGQMVDVIEHRQIDGAMALTEKAVNRVRVMKKFKV